MEFQMIEQSAFDEMKTLVTSLRAVSYTHLTLPTSDLV